MKIGVLLTACIVNSCLVEAEESQILYDRMKESRNARNNKKRNFRNGTAFVKREIPTDQDEYNRWFEEKRGPQVSSRIETTGGPATPYMQEGEATLKMIKNFQIDPNDMGSLLPRTLTVVDSMKSKLDKHRPLTTEQVGKLKEKMNIQWTYHSNAIEGSSLTEQETEAVVRGYSLSGNCFREMKEVKNHLEAIKYIESLVRKKQMLTSAEIIETQGLILKEIKPQHAGMYRTDFVLVRGGRSLPPEDCYVNELMDMLLDWYNQPQENLHPILKIAVFHGKFEQIHPFMDGNGRTGRLIMNAQLMKLGYPPAIIRVSQKDLYYEALEAAHLRNDYKDLTLQIALHVKTSLQMYLDAIDNAQTAGKQ